jgi:methylmalonyl-CoA mutase
MQNGIIQQNISSHREKLQKDIAIRKSTLLGVNQFPNLDAPPLSAYHQESQQSEKGLYPIRLAEPFERLRLATERYIAAGHQRPLAYLLKFGNPAISNARATWSLNFLACAGIASVEGNTDLDTAVKELFSTGAQIIVLCGENDSWLLTLPDILSKIPEKSIKILSGKGDIGHVDFCIYEGCDARSALSNLLEKLGISI